MALIKHMHKINNVSMKHIKALYESLTWHCNDFQTLKALVLRNKKH